MRQHYARPSRAEPNRRTGDFAARPPSGGGPRPARAERCQIADTGHFNLFVSSEAANPTLHRLAKPGGVHFLVTGEARNPTNLASSEAASFLEIVTGEARNQINGLPESLRTHLFGLTLSRWWGQNVKLVGTSNASHWVRHSLSDGGGRDLNSGSGRNSNSRNSDSV